MQIIFCDVLLLDLLSPGGTPRKADNDILSEVISETKRNPPETRNQQTRLKKTMKIHRD